jgi:hypothetical protein
MTLNRNVSGRKTVEENAVILFDEGGAAFQALRFGDRRLIARNGEMLGPHSGLGHLKMPPYDSKFAGVFALACTETFWYRRNRSGCPKNSWGADENL